MTPQQLLTQRTATDSAAPFITWYGPDGRVELSVATFSNAVAKLAGLLESEIELQAGDHVRLDLPLHWQLSVWLAACDALGADVSMKESANPTVVATMNPHCDLAGDKVLVPNNPLGLPGPPAPVNVIDQAREVPGQPDVFPVTGAAGRVWSTGSWLRADDVEAECHSIADRIGLAPGGRLAVVGEPGDRLIGCYLLPLQLGASVVLKQDPTANIDNETITAIW